MTEVVIIDSGGANLASLRFALERLGARPHVSSDGSTIASAKRLVLPGVGAAAHAMERLNRSGLITVLRTLTQPVLGICLGMQLLFQRSEEGDRAAEELRPVAGEDEVSARIHWIEAGEGLRNQPSYAKPARVIRSRVFSRVAQRTAFRNAVPLLARADLPSGTKCLGLLPAMVRRLTPTRERPVPHMGWNTLHRLSADPLLAGVNEADYAYFVHSYAIPITEHTLATTDYGGAISAVVRRGNFWGTQFHPERSGPTGERILRNFLQL
jgi:imidazole glycerol-phosphate synthase subunit HisH